MTNAYTSPVDEERKRKLVTNIQDNYRQIEQSIVNQLYMKHDLHGSTTGSAREEIWRQLFEMIVPKKFVIEQSVFIIDSCGRVSNEVDLVIFDETYTPYIFRYGRLKFIPIEAAAVVVECKSQSLDKDRINDWYEHIKELKTSNNSIARTVNFVSVGGGVATQESTRPIRILCALKTKTSPEIREKFDIVLLADDEISGRIDVQYNMDDNLQVWFERLNFNQSKRRKEKIEKISSGLEKIKLKDYEVRDPDDEPVSLLSFNFQLNQLLMLINNPLLFPHRAYANLFHSGKRDSDG